MIGATDLIVIMPSDLCCPAGDSCVDPWRPVDRAVITHAHSDHARIGYQYYLTVAPGAGVLRARLGANIPLQTLPYGESIVHHGVRLDFRPAGHVLGSAQVRLEYGGDVWVVSGDYKVEADSICTPFEPVRCNTFITESTFGLPIYHWRPQAEILAQLNAQWHGNAEAGRTSMAFCCAFGKVQRILSGLDTGIGPIVSHGAMLQLNAAYRHAGVALPLTQLATSVPRADLRRALVLALSSAQRTAWTRRFSDYADAFVSGWMQLRGVRRRRSVDHGITLSDHTGWPGLLQAIDATSATRIYVTHGQAAPMVRWLSERGPDVRAFATGYGDEAEESEAAGTGDTPTAGEPEDTPVS